jgi:hypothetical protein
MEGKFHHHLVGVGHNTELIQPVWGQGDPASVLEKQHSGPT